MLLFQVQDCEMVKVRKVEDIVNQVVRGVELLEVDKEVNPMELRDPAGRHWEDLERGDFLPKNSDNYEDDIELLQFR